MEFDELSRNVIGCAIEVHRNLGPGLLESTYRQCLACELSHARIPFQMELPLPVRYKDLCSMAAIGSICSDIAISSSKARASKRFFQSIKHKFLRTCDSRTCDSPRFAWLVDQFQRHKVAKQHQTFRSVTLRALRVFWCSDPVLQ